MGLDFSRHKVDVAIHNALGQPLERRRSFANTQAGYAGLRELVLSWLARSGGQQLIVAGEATSYYWLLFFRAMALDPGWQAYGLVQYLLNARWVHWFKKAKSPNHKTDDIDAGDLADYARLHPPKTAWVYDEHWLSLRMATRLRYHLAHSLTREKNLAHLYLFLLYPSFTQRKPFANPFGVTSQRWLTLFDEPLEEEQQSLAELAEELQVLSQQHLPQPLKNAQRLQQVLNERFPLSDALRAPLQLSLNLLLETIAHLLAQIHTVDTWIEAQVEDGSYPEIGYLRSIPGVGPVLASGIAVEIGDLTRFSQERIWDVRRRRERLRTASELSDALHKYAGLWWPKNQSGTFDAEDRPLSRAGNRYLRYYVIQAAERLRLRLPSFAAFYDQKYQQVTKHQHKRALVLTGCKALDLFVTLLRRQEDYRAKEEMTSLV